MDVEASAARAAALREMGDPARALAVLRSAVVTRPESIDARLALASHYREIGSPDQAARWGSVIDGWPTEKEMNRLARQMAAKDIRTMDEAQGFLLLPDGIAPNVVKQLFIDVVPGFAAAFESRRRFRSEVRSRPVPVRERSEFSDVVVFPAWITLIFGALLGVGGVFVGSFFGVIEPRETRGVVFALLVALGFVVLITGVSSLRRKVATGWWSVAAGAAVALVAIWVWIATGLEFG